MVADRPYPDVLTDALRASFGLKVAPRACEAFNVAVRARSGFMEAVRVRIVCHSVFIRLRV